MYGCNVHEARYQNNEIHSPGLRGLDPMVEQIQPYSEHALNLMLILL